MIDLSAPAARVLYSIHVIVVTFVVAKQASIVSIIGKSLTRFFSQIHPAATA